LFSAERSEKMTGSQRVRENQKTKVSGKIRRLVFPISLVVFLTLFCAPALGALNHPFKETIGPFTSPAGMAIDKTTGNVLLADGGSNNAIEIFGPQGGPPVGVVKSRIGGFAFNEDASLAFDNSPISPSKDTLYVTDTGNGSNGSVKKFTFEPISEEYKEEGTLTASPAFRQPLGVAVDAKGNVFVSDRPDGSADGVIVEFDPTGMQIDRVRFSESSPTLKSGTDGLAFDSAGNLYAVSHYGTGIWKFAPNGSGEIELGAAPARFPFPQVNATGIAIDQATDGLYVALGRRIEQYSTSCTPTEEKCEPQLEFGIGTLSSTRGVAVNPTSGDIYVTDAGSGAGDGDVVVFGGPLAIVPDPEAGPATEVRQTSATLNGAVSAAGGPPASCEFQYTTSAIFLDKRFETASVVPCSPTGPFTGTARTSVEAEISGLDPETSYVFRVVAANENGPDFGAAVSFGTVGRPQIDATSIGLVTLDDARVEGQINPNGGPNAAVETTYAAEYVSKADFEVDGYAKAVEVPAGGESIGSGTEDVKVTQKLSALSEFSTYHFRIVAENEAGEEKGPDMTFTTYPAQDAGLPDDRVYEQVTPVDKNGAAPSGEVGQIQAASKGDRFLYFSHGGIPGSDGAQKEPVYLSSRGLDWSSQGLLPPASEGPAAAVMGWSEDLTRAYVAQSALPVQSPVSFLERESSTHSLRSIVAEGGDAIPSAFGYVGASIDGSVVAFESEQKLPAGGAEKAPNIYVWNKESGEVTLAGVFNKEPVPAKGTLAGSNEITNRHHYLQAQHTLSSDGSGLFFNDVNSGQLYLRQNPTRPQSALDGEGGCAEPTSACTLQVSASHRSIPDPLGPKPATFMTATPSGSAAFFTSAAKLTNNATTGPGDEGSDLYRFDTADGTLTDLTRDTGDKNGAEVRGVLGVSEDGSRVYFTANGVLTDTSNARGEIATPGNCSMSTVTQAGTGACNLYLSQEGVITYIARLKLDGEYARSDSANWLSTPQSQAPGIELTARVTPDGGTLLFRSQRRLTDYDNDANGECTPGGGKSCPEYYRYSAAGDELTCVSCSPTDAAPSGPATLRSIFAPLELDPQPASVLTRNLAADGNRVFFESLDKLVVTDTNGDNGCPFLNEELKVGRRSCLDVYEWEAKGTGSCESEKQNGGCLYLVSTGTSPAPSYFGDADDAGSNAFFYAVEPLVGQDIDEIVDIYDARVGGGIASQNPPPVSPACPSPEACRSGVPVPPSSQSPGSAGFLGPGNQKPPQKKKRGKRKSNKKKHHKKRHAARGHG
jgi:sugar lactone lactonase YvrE